jgi:hypothetical protein
MINIDSNNMINIDSNNSNNSNNNNKIYNKINLYFFFI